MRKIRKIRKEEFFCICAFVLYVTALALGGSDLKQRLIYTIVFAVSVFALIETMRNKDEYQRIMSIINEKNNTNKDCDNC